MAAEGKSAREILGFYFPGTAVRILRGDDGWQEMRSGPLTLRATYPISAEQRAAIESTWSKAQTLFPARRAIAPEILFAPSTEVFRQLTNQPGWMLASTSGTTIVLQPDAILRARSTTASATMLHEMLHVLVEAESAGRAPLWLREGLVEVLAGEAAEGPNTMSTSAIENALLHADSWQASKSAHYAAAARVRLLLGRYGPSTVRGWLSSGVPAGVE